MIKTKYAFSEAKAKDMTSEAKAKDLTPKAKDLPPGPRPRTWPVVLEAPWGQGHGLKDSISGLKWCVCAVDIW